MAYATVADYIAAARTLLQDVVSPYRYEDAGLVEALNNAFAVMNRLRPDILLSYNYAYGTQVARTRTTPPADFPTYTANIETAPVTCPTPYQESVLFYVVGYAQARDTEDAQDVRATKFMSRFMQDLLTNM